LKQKGKDQMQERKAKKAKKAGGDIAIEGKDLEKGAEK